MNTPEISVVMAAKNYARFLQAAVESVFAQHGPTWELVIIDDGSTDDTPAAVRPFLADPRVRYIRSDSLGQSRAKNLGVRFARGEFIAFLDADDIWLPGKLAAQLAVFRANPAVGVVFSRRRLIDAAGHPLPNPPARPAPRGDVFAEMFARNFVCFSSAVVRRDVFDRVGGFDPNLDLSIDYDLWLRAARHTLFDYVDDELVLYRTGHGNLSAKLADRIAIAFSVMHKVVFRRRDTLPDTVIADGYASTARGLAWLLRKDSPLAAVRWYLRALAWPAGRAESVKGLFGTLVRRGGVPLTAENRPENA